LADSLGLSPEDYVNALLERAAPRRRIDLMPLGFKVKVAETIAEVALETLRKTLIVWSGGKDSTVVRVGRAQDKEGIMELLRKYGYM